MRTEDFERFIAVVEKLKAEEAAAASSAAAPASAAGVNSSCVFKLSDFTFERSGARGYYVMSLASHPTIQIDVVEYITVTEKDEMTGKDVQILKHNMDDETYSGFFYPDYPIEWVFPLKRVNMLGWPTLLPRDSDAVTRSHFGANYMQVLWVPWLLTKLYNPFLTKTLWQGPVRDAPVASSYQEGFKLYGTSSPFIVRAPKEFAHITLDSLRAFCLASDAEVFGYDNAGEVIEGLRVSDVVRQWDRDELTAKVLDSPLECATLPEDFVALDEQTDEDKAEQQAAAAAASAASSSAAADASAVATPAAASAPGGGGVPSNRNAAQAGLGLMLTRANAYTFLHLDPPTYGGGWMYLVSGQKSWTYLAPEYIDLLYDPTTKRLRDLPVSELVTRFGYALHGKLLHTTAREGDLVYFPPCWMHRVRTFDKCIGISGYMKLRQAHPQMKQWTDALDKKGLNSIWNGNDNI
jgi:hypothetical protein